MSRWGDAQPEFGRRLGERNEDDEQPVPPVPADAPQSDADRAKDLTIQILRSDKDSLEWEATQLKNENEALWEENEMYRQRFLLLKLVVGGTVFGSVVGFGLHYLFGK